MNFKRAEKYLESLQEKTKKFELKPMQELVKKNNLDIAQLKVIHITGSNGKGSTAAFVSSILKENGFLVGTYTSPHLRTVRERIKINGKKISKKDFAKQIFDIKKVSKKMRSVPSYFETITTAAIKHFLEKKVDFVVAEVGMGGRFDATNVLNGTVNVITDISLEHTKTLGNTIEKIAKEKGQIIKKNSLTVISKKNTGFNTIKNIAEQKNSTIISPEFRTLNSTINKQKFFLKKPILLKNLEIFLLGEFQIENASLALTAIYCLQQRGYKFSIKSIFFGLKKTFWPARIDQVQKNPLIVIDSTHTTKGAGELTKVINKFKINKIIVIFSCLIDKDFKKILKIIPFDFLIATKVDYKRALEPEIIQKSFPKAVVEKEMVFALNRAKKLAAKNDLILVTGSIYGAGEAMKALKVKS